jgi:predicted O-methyltransferase YrrM
MEEASPMSNRPNLVQQIREASLQFRTRMKHALLKIRRPGGMQAEDYPSLEAKHLDNPRLFASREDLISSLGFSEGGTIAEVGVADGYFSDFLLSQLRPSKFVAFDIFTMHKYTTSWAGRTNMFGGMTQLEHYRRKFADRGSQVIIEVGMSQRNLAKYPDNSFDLIYIDGDHSYAGVRQDTNLAKIKIADNGIIVFNDYIIYDYINNTMYGVIRAVNELVINEDWRVCGFSLNWGMFCDIAVRKPR